MHILIECPLLEPHRHHLLTATVIDAGSNLLRYNVHNWQFDWNWYVLISRSSMIELFMPHTGISISTLKYFNLSGNKKLDLKQNNGGKRVVDDDGRILSDFSQLRSFMFSG